MKAHLPVGFIISIYADIRFDDITQQLANPPEPVVVYNQFPSDAHHNWKYLRFDPDNKHYTVAGAPCYICLPEEIFASLFRLNPDGSDVEIIDRGIRNTVVFDWQSGTNA
ncbi:MAG: hypothetical protein PHD43_04445 [Methylococcales bacterium]|nr:hypothetical protein [Methylococcales bacterium]